MATGFDGFLNVTNISRAPHAPGNVPSNNNNGSMVVAAKVTKKPSLAFGRALPKEQTAVAAKPVATNLAAEAHKLARELSRQPPSAASALRNASVRMNQTAAKANLPQVNVQLVPDSNITSRYNAQKVRPVSAVHINHTAAPVAAVAPVHLQAAPISVSSKVGRSPAAASRYDTATGSNPWDSIPAQPHLASRDVSKPAARAQSAGTIRASPNSGAALIPRNVLSDVVEEFEDSDWQPAAVTAPAASVQRVSVHANAPQLKPAAAWTEPTANTNRASFDHADEDNDMDGSEIMDAPDVVTSPHRFSVGKSHLHVPLSPSSPSPLASPIESLKSLPQSTKSAQRSASRLLPTDLQMPTSPLSPLSPSPHSVSTSTHMKDLVGKSSAHQDVHQFAPSEVEVDYGISVPDGYYAGQHDPMASSQLRSPVAALHSAFASESLSTLPIEMHESGEELAVDPLLSPTRALPVPPVQSMSPLPVTASSLAQSRMSVIESSNIASQFKSNVPAEPASKAFSSSFALPSSFRSSLSSLAPSAMFPSKGGLNSSLTASSSLSSSMFRQLGALSQSFAPTVSVSVPVNASMSLDNANASTQQLDHLDTTDSALEESIATPTLHVPTSFFMSPSAATPKESFSNLSTSKFIRASPETVVEPPQPAAEPSLTASMSSFPSHSAGALRSSLATPSFQLGAFASRLQHPVSASFSMLSSMQLPNLFADVHASAQLPTTPTKHQSASIRSPQHSVSSSRLTSMAREFASTMQSPAALASSQLVATQVTSPLRQSTQTALFDTTRSPSVKPEFDIRQSLSPDRRSSMSHKSLDGVANMFMTSPLSSTRHSVLASTPIASTETPTRGSVALSSTHLSMQNSPLPRSPATPLDRRTPMATSQSRQSAAALVSDVAASQVFESTPKQVSRLRISTVDDQTSTPLASTKSHAQSPKSPSSPYPVTSPTAALSDPSIDAAFEEMTQVMRRRQQHALALERARIEAEAQQAQLAAAERRRTVGLAAVHRLLSAKRDAIVEPAVECEQQEQPLQSSQPVSIDDESVVDIPEIEDAIDDDELPVETEQAEPDALTEDHQLDHDLNEVEHTHEPQDHDEGVVAAAQHPLQLDIGAAVNDADLDSADVAASQELRFQTLEREFEELKATITPPALPSRSPYARTSALVSPIATQQPQSPSFSTGTHAFTVHQHAHSSQFEHQEFDDQCADAADANFETHEQHEEFEGQYEQPDLLAGTQSADDFQDEEQPQYFDADDEMIRQQYQEYYDERDMDGYAEHDPNADEHAEFDHQDEAAHGYTIHEHEDQFDDQQHDDLQPLQRRHWDRVSASWKPVSVFDGTGTLHHLDDEPEESRANFDDLEPLQHDAIVSEPTWIPENEAAQNQNRHSVERPAPTSPKFLLPSPKPQAQPLIQSHSRAAMSPAHSVHISTTSVPLASTASPKFRSPQLSSPQNGSRAVKLDMDVHALTSDPNLSEEKRERMRLRLDERMKKRQDGRRDMTPASYEVDVGTPVVTSRSDAKPVVSARSDAMSDIKPTQTSARRQLSEHMEAQLQQHDDMKRQLQVQYAEYMRQLQNPDFVAPTAGAAAPAVAAQTNKPSPTSHSSAADASGATSARRESLGEGKKSKTTPSSAQPPVLGRKSNRNFIKNALQYVCLSGGAATAERTVALHALDSSDEHTFLIVFSQDRSLRFKGVYTVELQRQRARKLFELPDANLPEVIEAADMSAFFKYDSGAKTFREISGIRELSTTTDACVLARRRKQ